MLSVEVLGPFAVRDDRQEPVAFEARSAAAVVALTALSRGRSLARESVASELWPNADESTARTNLRKALQRVRRAIGENGPLVADGECLRLSLDRAQTDLERADRLHRTFLLASRQPEGTAALTEEWELRRKPLLAGWDDEWVLPHRTRAERRGIDLGCELAQTYESIGDAAAALKTWREILERVPHHAQAIGNALRLELQVHGREGAAELARTAQHVFRDELGIEMPLGLRRAVREVRSGSSEPVPAPEFLRKRSELHLLARMFEANLASNRGEALALLAQECTLNKALAHPRAMLGLLTLALDRTSGISPDRIRVASLAAMVASVSAEFDVGHHWCDFIVSSTPISDPIHGYALSIKGFMHFEQRDFAASERMLLQSIEVLKTTGRSYEARRAQARLAGLKWHLLEYDEATALYEDALRGDGDASPSDVNGLLITCEGNLCFVNVYRHRWEEAIRHGRNALSVVEDHPGYGYIVSAPLGFALAMSGQLSEGLRLLSGSLAATLRENMQRFNQINLDLSAIALFTQGKVEAARSLVQAVEEHRAALHHERSPAEASLISSFAGLNVPPKQNPLLGQSAATLTEWTCEEIDRLLEPAISSPAAR